MSIPVSEFNEFKPFLKTTQTRFQWSAGLLLSGIESWKIEYNFKWDQPYLNRGLN